MPMMKKRQMVVEEGDEGRTAAELFYSLAASSLPQIGATAPSRPLEQNLRQSYPEALKQDWAFCCRSMLRTLVLSPELLQ